MSEPAPLDETARELIAAGREGVAPNEFVAERLRRSVERTLRGSAPPARSRSRTAPILAALGAAALGGALYANELARTKQERAVLPKSTPPAMLAPQSPSAALPTAAPAPPNNGTAAPPNDMTAQTPTGGRAEPPRPSRSQQLSAEIELLARVNAAVNAGDGGRALGLLGEYDLRFRPSILGEERAAASVLALCAAGRTDEARAAADRFAHKWKHSPLLGRIKRSCAGAQ